MFDKFFPASSSSRLISANLEFNSLIIAIYISLLISPKPNFDCINSIFTLCFPF